MSQTHGAETVMWLIEEGGGWFLGVGRDGSDGAVGHWYADTPLAWHFITEADAIQKLAEHKLVCKVGVDGGDGRPMSCFCDKAEVVSRLWPSGNKIDVCPCCDKIVPAHATSFALSGENNGPWYFVCMNCQRKGHYECLDDAGGRVNPMGWCKRCRAERSLTRAS